MAEVTYGLNTTITFEAAHRLYNVATYSDECRENLHGHSYRVNVRVYRNKLNDAGMVMDFKLLKKILKENIEDVYDHCCILKYDDPLVDPVRKNCKKVIIAEESPTAEWMAEKYYNLISRALADVDDQLKVRSVEVQETERNIAIYEGDHS